jgi:phage terminase large subunit
MGKTKDEAKNRAMRSWKARPEKFFHEVLEADPWYKQIEILHSVRDNKETYVKSCNAAGKSFLAARLVLWWLFTRRGKVVTTAPTWRQVREILWNNIRAACERAPQLGVKPMQTKLEIGPEWFAVGLSTKVPDKFQGYHGNVLIVVDEASGVNDEEIWAAIDGNLTDHRHDRLLAIGNPLDPDSVFARKFKIPEKKGIIKHITISAYDTPNFIDKKNTVQGLITPEWAEQKLIEWGENSPLYQARVLGEFPKVGTAALFPMHWLERAFNYDTVGRFEPRVNEPDEWVPGYDDLSNGPSVLGLDVSGSGVDNNAMSMFTGTKLQAIVGWPGVDSSDILGDDGLSHDQPTFFNWVTTHRPDTGIIDALGLGDPIFKYAQKHVKANKDKYKGFRLRAFKASRAATRADKFANWKAEAYWNVRNLLQENKLDLSNVPFEMREVLQRQSNAIRWRTNPKGLIIIEDKDVMRKREGFSPDELESMIMALAGLKKPRLDKDIVGTFDYSGNDSDFDSEHEQVGAFEYDFLQYSR